MARDSKEKAKAREERNKAQAIEETTIWKHIEQEADKAVAIYKSKGGAPSKYTEELGREIASRISEGQSLSSICKMPHMPDITTIYEWIGKQPTFSLIYARAREQAAHTLFDQMIDIADDSSADLLEDGTPNNAAIARARLQIDTRARVAGKLAPRVYGERIEALASTVNVTNNNLTIDSRALDGDQRASLRAMLLQARDNKTIDN